MERSGFGFIVCSFKLAKPRNVLNLRIAQTFSSGTTCNGAEFIAILGGAASWPLTARAQPKTR
jgi:hypothetical protein